MRHGVRPAAKSLPRRSTKRFALRLSGHVDAGTAAMVFVDGTGKLGTNTVAANGNKVAVPTPQVMLNELLKEHKKVEEQQASISQLKSEMHAMVAQLKEQAAQIQKVSAQVEVNKPAPQVVASKP